MNRSPDSIRNPDVVITRGLHLQSSKAYDGLTRKVMAFNENLMLVEHTMERGAVFPKHSHPHDQLAFLISGHIRVRAGQETFEARGGDSFVIRGNVDHEVTALERSIALDIFTPVRRDYLPTDAYQ